MTTERENCSHIKIGKDGKCTECGKRMITPYKGGRDQRIACRVTDKTKAMFDEMAANQPGTNADCLESIIHDAYKKFKKKQ